MRKLVAATIGLLLILVSVAGARPVDPFTYDHPEFCSGAIVEDFGIPALPAVNQLPEDGSLPFGPRSVEMWGGGDMGRVVPPGGSFGYHFTDRDYHRDPLVDWQVTARLLELDEAGGVVGEVDRGRLWIHRVRGLGELKLYLDPPRRPAFYRYDIQFKDRDGKQLGAYSEYLKVVAPFWRPSVAVNRAQYKPGQLVLSRVENFGTEAVYYGEGYGVQRLQAGGAWKSVPRLTPNGSLLWLGIQGPGSAGRCSALRLPKDVAPGTYRIVKDVGRSPRWSRDEGAYYLTAPFSVR